MRFLIIFLFSLLYADLTDLPDSTTSVSTSLNSVDINNTTNEKTSINSPVDVKGMYEAIKSKNVANEGFNIIKNINFPDKNFFSDIKQASTDYLREHYDSNSSIIKSLDTLKNVMENMNLKTQQFVKCYITRKLNTAYYCPLPNRDDSYYVGGGSSDDKEYALNRCNADCKNPLNVLVKETAKEKEKKIVFNKIINSSSVSIPLDNELKLNTLSLNIALNAQIKPLSLTNGFGYINYLNYDAFFNYSPSTIEKMDIYFDYQDENNTALVEWEGSELSLIKRVKGKETLIKKITAKTFNNQVNYSLKLSLRDDSVSFYIDNVLYLNGVLKREKGEIGVNFPLTSLTYSTFSTPLYIDYNITDSNNNFISSGTITFYSGLAQEEVYFFSPFSTLNINFSSLYTLNNRVKEAVNEEVELKDVYVKYVDSNFYYCPNQFVENITECDGEIVDVEIGGNVYHICSTHNPGPAKEYAYYTLQSAKNNCYEEAKCLPTYRHLLGDFSSKTLPSWAYEVETGCVDTPDNSLCTQDICDKLLNDPNAFPAQEKVWIRDDKVIDTITNSKVINERPRVALGAELLGENRDVAFVEEMKDAAYKEMIQSGTFTMSLYPISTNIPHKSSVEVLRDNINSKVDFVWRIKGNSFDYDNSKSYYFYSVIKIDSIYYNKLLKFKDKEGIYKSAIELGISDIDSTYLIKTPTSYKVIKKVESAYRKMPQYDDNGTIIGYSTITPPDKKEYYQIFDDKNNEWLNYSLSDQAPYFTQMDFESNRIFNTFYLINDFYNTLLTTPGVLIHSQSIQNYSLVKDYISAEDELTKSRLYSFMIYGFYSDTPLSYQEIFERLTDENVIYDSKNPGKYTLDIPDDTPYNKDKVKLFIFGRPENFSAIAKFTPSFDEEGKKSFIFMFLYDK